MKKSKLALGSVALGLLLGACAQRPADPTGAVMPDQATGLQVPIYKPTAHYDAVKDKWIGTTPHRTSRHLVVPGKEMRMRILS